MIPLRSRASPSQNSNTPSLTERQVCSSARTSGVQTISQTGLKMIGRSCGRTQRRFTPKSANKHVMSSDRDRSFRSPSSKYLGRCRVKSHSMFKLCLGGVRLAAIALKASGEDASKRKRECEATHGQMSKIPILPSLNKASCFGLSVGEMWIVQLSRREG